MTEIGTYNICQNLKFDLDKIEYYCSTKHYNFKRFIAIARNYILKNTNNLIDLDDTKLEFVCNNKNIANAIKKYSKIILSYSIQIKINCMPDFLDIINDKLLGFIITTHYNKDLIEKAFVRWDLNYEETIEDIIKYIINNRLMTKEELKNNFKDLYTKRIESKKEFIDQILNTNDLDELVNIMKNSIQDISKINLAKFCMEYYKDNYKDVYNSLKKKIDACNSYIQTKDDNTKDDKLAMATSYITKYIESDCENAKDFCLKNNITYYRFNKFLNLIKVLKPDLYKLYTEKNKSIIKDNYQSIIEVGNNIVNYIKSGITVNGIKRPFDLLDYYQLTDIEPSTILSVLMSSKSKNWFTFLSFTKKYAYSLSLTEKRIEKILASKDIINVEFDEAGNMIPNSGYEITKEDKETVINYLKDNNIPLLEDVYYIALKRYLNNELIIKDKNK